MEKDHGMKRLLYIGALAILGCGSPEQRQAHRALRAGAAFYADSLNFVADSAYATAPADERCVFNRGNAAFRMSDWTAAIEHYRSAAAMDTTPNELALIRFALGNTHYAQARDADTTIPRIQRTLAGIRVEGDDIAQKVSSYVQRDSLSREVIRLDALIDSSLTAAITIYKQALRHSPGDDSLRWNLVLAQREAGLREAAKKDRGDGKNDSDKDKALSARALVLMQHADSLVEIYRFKDALDMLQKGLQQDPTLKSKKEYMEKLDLVTKAAAAT